MVRRECAWGVCVCISCTGDEGISYGTDEGVGVCRANLTFNVICHGKVKFNLKQATNSQRESRGVAVPFL